MALTLTIIGLPSSGKTTVFNALTRAHAETATFTAAGTEPNRAVVKVPDPRLDLLCRLFQPKKCTPADVEYVDIAGLGQGLAPGSPGGGVERVVLDYLAKAEALVHVVRVFDDPAAPHPLGSVDPVRDLEAMDLELAFADLEILERRVQRLEDSAHKVKVAEREGQQRELELLRRLKDELIAGQPLRAQSLSPDEQKAIRGFQFLTAKPLLVLLNTDEAHRPEAEALQQEYRAGPGTDLAVIGGRTEMELAQLSDEEAEEFRQAMNLGESSLGRVIRLSYALLGLISFFTVGPDECRAWTIERGTPAVEAAGKIHSDLQRGFIRAEVTGYDDLVAAQSLTEAKKRGVLRMEGKQYIVRDGDIMHVLFNV